MFFNTVLQCRVCRVSLCKVKFLTLEIGCYCLLFYKSLFHWNRQKEMSVYQEAFWPEETVWCGFSCSPFVHTSCTVKVHLHPPFGINYFKFNHAVFFTRNQFTPLTWFAAPFAKYLKFIPLFLKVCVWAWRFSTFACFFQQPPTPTPAVKNTVAAIKSLIVSCHEFKELHAV